MEAGFFRSLWIHVYSAYVTLRISVIVIYYSFRNFPDARTRGDRLLHWWSKRLLRVIRLHYSVHRVQPLRLLSGKPYIIMCNHCSFYDIPLSLLAVKGSIRMITKKELFRVPLWGRGLRVGEFIPIDRGNRAQAIRQLAYAKAKLESGIMLWIAPEGTRSRDGRLKKLKKGGFKLALQTNAAVIPLCIVGADKIYSSQRRRFYLRRKIDVYVGDPVEAADYAENIDGLMSAIERHLKPPGHADGTPKI